MGKSPGDKNATKTEVWGILLLLFECYFTTWGMPHIVPFK